MLSNGGEGFSFRESYSRSRWLKRVLKGRNLMVFLQTSTEKSPVMESYQFDRIMTRLLPIIFASEWTTTDRNTNIFSM